MPSKASSTINLGLPDIPETSDPKLFQELVRVYNAIKLLAQFIDIYTADGTLVDQTEGALAEAASSITQLRIKLRALAGEIEELPSNTATLWELRKRYYRYSVPVFTVSGLLTVIGDAQVIGKFACNGKPVQASYALGAVAGNATAGGIGTAAGGWDTAANRDATIATINAHAIAINALQIALKNNGIGV